MRKILILIILLTVALAKIQTKENRMALTGLTNTVSFPLIDNVAQGFGGLGNFSGVVNNAAQTLGAATDMYNGTIYYDPATGQIGGTNMDGSPITKATDNSGGNTAPTYSSQQLATREQANMGKNNIINTANSAIENAKGTTRNSVLDFLDSQRIGQQGIDSSAANNELNKRRAYGGIEDMIGTGIRSAGTMLANKNASSSSAGEAIANAYAKLGNRQAGAANNQFELANESIANQQNAYNVDRASKLRKFGTDKESFVNGLVSDAETKLMALNEALMGASLPDRMAIEQEKANIKNNALSQLAEFDTMITSGVGAINPANREQTIAKAGQMDAAGQASANPFSYSTNTDVAYQNGAPVTDLPLFTTSSKRRFQGA